MKNKILFSMILILTLSTNSFGIELGEAEDGSPLFILSEQEIDYLMEQDQKVEILEELNEKTEIISGISTKRF